MVANYPWDGSPGMRTVYAASPDDATFRHLAKAYAANHGSMGASHEFADGITNGAQWYPLQGGMQVGSKPWMEPSLFLEMLLWRKRNHLIA